MKDSGSRGSVVRVGRLFVKGMLIYGAGARCWGGLLVQSEVITRSPVSIQFAQILGPERGPRDGGSSRSDMGFGDFGWVPTFTHVHSSRRSRPSTHDEARNANDHLLSGAPDPP